MTSVIDRAMVARSFHRHADGYDKYATVQRRVVSNLVRLVGIHTETPPAALLDIGCGTGALAAALSRTWPTSAIFGIDLAMNMARHTAERLGTFSAVVNGDAEMLPFRNGSFDLVVSASTLQWLNSLDACLADSFRVLKNGGLLCMAFFGGRTLLELQECYCEALYRRSGIEDQRMKRLHRFFSIDDVQQSLSRIDAGKALIFSDLEMDYRADLKDLLTSIKGIGAGTAVKSGNRSGLGWRGILNDTNEIYRERYLQGDVIPATFEVIYLVVRKYDVSSS